MTVFWPWGGVWRWRVVEEEEEGWEEDFKEGNTHSRLLTTPPSLFLWWYLSSPPPPQRIRLTYSSIYKHKQGNKSFTWQLCLFSWSTISHVCSLVKKKKMFPSRMTKCKLADVVLLPLRQTLNTKDTQSRTAFAWACMLKMANAYKGHISI